MAHSKRPTLTITAPPLPQKSHLKIGVFFFLVFWLCIWLIIQSVSPHLPRSTEPPRLYSNQAQQDLRLTLVESIKQATDSIHLVMFGLNDPSIVNALAKQTVPTTIYYDPNGSPNLWNTLPNCTLHPVHGFGLMHQKILIVDKETVFIGSANMTTASLTMHDNLVIGFKSQKVAQFLRDKSPQTSGYLRAMVGGQEIEVWLLPDPRAHALQDLRRKIRSAHQSIRIALFTFTHPALVDEVIAAHHRGINVSLVVDLHSGLGASKDAIEKIKRAGIKVYMSQGMQLLHHKFILIDDRMLVTGSANWTKAAFYKNSDCILVLHHLNATQKSFMNGLWGRIESEARLMKEKAY